MSSFEPKTVALLGIPFHDVTMAETLDEIDAVVAARTPRYIATANLDFAAQASGDVELLRILLDAHLVLCDGTPLVWASRWLAAPLRERVAGSDLTPKLAERAAERGHRLFFFGSDEAILLTAKGKLEAQYPGLQVCGAYSPPYAKLLDLDHEEIERRIREARPDIVLVCLGAPKQEKWIYMHYRKLGVPLCIGLGASLDFIAGKVSRAPVWMQKSGLEWVYRLLQEPRRLFHRYSTDAVFFWKMLRAQKKLLHRSLPPVPEVSAGAALPGLVSYQWIGRADAATAAEILAKPFPTPTGANVALDLSRVNFIDSSGLGLILKGFKHCKEAGGELILLNASAVVRDLVHVSKLERLLPAARTLEEALAMLRVKDSATPPATHRHGDQRVVVHCQGELNAATADRLRDVVREKWEGEASAKILQIDFTRVNFIDSSGLGCLLRARKLVAAREGAALQLTGMNDNLRNVITLARLDEVLGLAQAS